MDQGRVIGKMLPTILKEVNLSRMLPFSNGKLP